MSLFGGSQKTQSNETPALGSLKIQTQGYGNVIPIVYGRVRLPVTLFFYSNFKATPHTEKAQSGGKGGMLGGGKQQGNTTYTYSAAVMMGVCNNGIIESGRLWVDKKIYPRAYLAGLSIMPGLPTQDPWGYLTSYEPTKAVSLRGFGYLFANNYALSDNATLGNHSLEVYGLFSSATGNNANIADILPHLLSTECGIAADKISVSNELRTATNAYGELFGLALTEQTEAASLVTDLLNICSAELVVRKGVLTVLGRYQSGLDSGYRLTSDDFIAEQGQPAIKPTRKKAIDCFNSLKLEFVNAANDYNIEIAEVKDEASIAEMGLRPAETIKAHYLNDASAARNIAAFILQRDLAARNSYEFTLSLRYICLEPMDLVSINDATLGLVNRLVMIKKVVITPDFKLHITAEDYNLHATTASYPAATSAPYTPNYNAAVGSINTPVLFAAPAVLTAKGYEIWCALSNTDALYGGCDIYISIDGGASYQRIGSHAGNARMGVLTANFASGADIDSTNTLAVDLTQSKGVLASVTQASVDMLETLCRVNNEFVAYRDVTLTSASHYTLGYFRRGLYGSSQGASTGNNFVRCDDALFRFPYSPLYAGKTIKLKFPAYNIYGSGQQDISTVTAYDFTIPGTVWDSGSAIWDGGSSLWIDN